MFGSIVASPSERTTFENVLSDRVFFSYSPRPCARWRSYIPLLSQQHQQTFARAMRFRFLGHLVFSCSRTDYAFRIKFLILLPFSRSRYFHVSYGTTTRDHVKRLSPARYSTSHDASNAPERKSQRMLRNNSTHYFSLQYLASTFRSSWSYDHETKVNVSYNSKPKLKHFNLPAQTFAPFFDRHPNVRQL